MRQKVFFVNDLAERNAIPVEQLEFGDIAKIRVYGPGGEFWGGEQDRWDGSRWVCEGLMGAPGPEGDSGRCAGHPTHTGRHDSRALIEYKYAIERQGEFGRRFLNYTGCPRGAVGRMGPAGGEELSHKDLLVREALSQPVIEDVDGGRWIPVNADVLHELVNAFKKEEK